MKKKRHELILQLIREHEIATQDELLALLRQHGFAVTQATVSRDIKELRLVKTASKGGAAVYMRSDQELQNGKVKKFYSIFSQSVISVDFAGNIAVVKCYAGTANAACAAIDAMAFEQVVGTLAGDDTVFVLCRSEQETKQFKEQIESMPSGEN